MAVRAGNLFALDGLGTSGTGIYDAVCKCIWGQEKSITGIWKSSGTLLSVECVVIQDGLRAGYNNPEETEKAVDREGWLHTGDIASLSEDGLLTLKGRCKDLIIRGGENISPREIEDFIRNYEPVEDVAVVGAPDEQYGELVYAFIRPKEGAVVTKEGLRNWCRGKIATIKIPQEIELTDHFPISATGKISKGQLRSLAREHLEGRGTRQTEPETESGGLRRSDRETAVSGQRAGETGKDGMDTWQKS